MRELKPREGPYRAYWNLAAERQKIFFARLRGEAPPWTADPILQTYKFCNAYRASDRVSQFGIRTVTYSDAAQVLSEEDQILRIVLFRLFSKIETWEWLERELGEPVQLRSTAQRERVAGLLDQRKAAGETIYTSAFILPSGSGIFSEPSKHRTHLRLIETMKREGISRAVARAGSMRELYQTLAHFPTIGPFLAYQIATDLNYSELCDFSESEFTVAGPGALRGVAKVFENTGGRSSEEIIQWMSENQTEEMNRLGIEFRDLGGRPLQWIDCQNLFCETDKYCRVAFPELASARTKIKQRFRPSDLGAEEVVKIARGEMEASAARGPIKPFYPPKWGVRLER